MKSARLLTFVLLAPALVFAQNGQNKKKHTLPAVFNQARYVFVESMDGDIYTPGLLPEDRQAIADVQNALDEWGRYVLTVNRSDADLIFVVRKGRLVEDKLGGSIGNTDPTGSTAPGQRQPRS